MAEIKLPDIRPAKTIEGKLDALYDAYYMMRKWLNYAFSGVLDEGNVIRAQEANIANLLAGKITADQIDVTQGKIQAAQIEDLIVGDNVIMGANATISWNQVTGTEQIPLRTDLTWDNLLNKPTNLLTQSQLTEALTNYVTTGQMTEALADTLNLGNFSTIITKDYIASMNLVVGREILMGANATISWSQVTNRPYIPTIADITTITANYIATPNLITNIAQVNNSLRLGSGATDAILTFRSGASIYSFNTVNGPYISFDVYGLQLLGNDIDCRGNWHFRNASVSGLENSGYVKQSNITAAIAAHVAAYHSS